MYPLSGPETQHFSREVRVSLLVRLLKRNCHIRNTPVCLWRDSFPLIREFLARASGLFDAFSAQSKRKSQFIPRFAAPCCEDSCHCSNFGPRKAAFCFPSPVCVSVGDKDDLSLSVHSIPLS